MNRLNAKRIGVLAASLLFGLAVASPVVFGNIQIINNLGQPVVQIVVGSTAQPSDGVVAANIAAVIGNLAFASTNVTYSIAGTAGLSCALTTTTPTCPLTAQKVWLGVSGAAVPSGTYGFTTLIGSVLNQAIQQNVGMSKYIASTGSLGYQRGYTTSNTYDSPYSAALYVPQPSVSGTSYEGGLDYSSFTGTSATGTFDNLLRVSSSQLPGLLYGAGTYSESETLWLTGLPVFDQNYPSPFSFAVLGAGGAYQVTFGKPIHEPYWTTTAIAGATGNVGGGTNTVNNAQIQMLGQNWTIIGYTPPGGAKASSSTVAVAGGRVALAASLSTLQPVYVGHNLTGSGSPFVVQLSDLGTSGSAAISPAIINVYYNGQLTNRSVEIWPVNTAKFNVSGNLLYVKVNSTVAGLYAYQKFARMQMYNNVFNVSNGQVFNSTSDPNWQINYLWTNASGNGYATDLQGIVLIDKNASTLLPGGSYTFIQNPQKWKVYFSPVSSLGNNFDTVKITTGFGNYNYPNTQTAAVSGKAGIGNIDNITEPSQTLQVQSSIPNAFTDGGFTGSMATYLLTPYTLTEVANAISANDVSGAANEGGAGMPVNVVLEFTQGYPTGNYVGTGTPPQLQVQITGFLSNAATSSYPLTVSFSNTVAGAITPLANSMEIAQTTGNFYNITGITLIGRALPGITIQVGGTVNTLWNSAGGTNTFSTASMDAGNLMAYLSYGVSGTTTPYIAYPVTNWVRYQDALVSGATLTYNQQNGQTPTSFTMSGPNPVLRTAGTNGPWSFFSYSMNEINTAPVNQLSQDSFSFNILNATSGTGQQTIFYLNYSASLENNNVTYTPSYSIAGSSAVHARQGFISERGSKVATISSGELDFNMAEAVDELQLIVSAAGTNTLATGQKVIGPYQIGQGNIPGLPNVTIANITASCAGSVAAGTGGCTVTGQDNLTAVLTPSVVSTPVKLDTSATPLVVLDSQANTGETLIVIGSKFVNSVAAQIFNVNSGLNGAFNTSSEIWQAEGSNRILIAGWYANQTVTAGNKFIQYLLAEPQ